MEKSQQEKNEGDMNVDNAKKKSCALLPYSQQRNDERKRIKDQTVKLQ